MEGGQYSIPRQGARSHMLQLKIPHAAAKIPCSHINFLNIKKKRIIGEEIVPSILLFMHCIYLLISYFENLEVFVLYTEQ